MIITTNWQAQGVLTQYKKNQRNMAITTGKLASGYKIRTAADNAAGLQISEGMRAQIRGLLRASQNSEEGAAFIRTGDGAMNEIASILQRMRELGVQSCNDTYTDEDRAKMQLEFDQLQSEIDRINDQSEYNTLPVFEHYADTYYVFEGNRYWSQDQLHRITDDNNFLKIQYQISEAEPQREITLQIPNGTYTTQELMDAMDDVVSALDGADGLYLEYTREGLCNMVLQNGEQINDVSGGLSYLFFGAYGGSEAGMLIGTTQFVPGYPLKVNNQNNELSFTIEYYTGVSKEINITVPEGSYSRQEMIDYLNTQLAGTGMQAMEQGEQCIKIGGDGGIITGLKGNMFKIDDSKTEAVMISVFYDNTKYGTVNRTESVFKGGAVLNAADTNAEYSQFHISDNNNTLSIKADPDSDLYHTIRLDNGDYSISEMRQMLQKKLDNIGMEINVSQYSSTDTTINGNRVTFYGLTLTSREKGPEVAIGFDQSISTAYDTLFVKRQYTDDANKVSVTDGTFSSTKASLTGGRTFENQDFPLEIDASNNTFQLKITETDAVTGKPTSVNYTIEMEKKVYGSLSDIINEIDRCMNGANAPVGLKDKIAVQNNGQKIQFSNSASNQTVTGIAFAETLSDGYKNLFVGSKTTTSTKTASSGASKTPSIILDKFTEPISLDSDKNLVVNVGGANRTVTVPAGNYTKDTLSEKITQLLKGGTVISPKSYSAFGKGSTTDNSKLTYSAAGTTTTASVDCNVKGTGTPLEGTTGEINTTSASYTTTAALPSSFTVKENANTLNININGTAYSVDVAPGDYTPQTLARALQNALGKATASKDFDNVKVTSGGNKLTFTTASTGSVTSLRFNVADSPLLYDLFTTNTVAKKTIDLPLNSTITIDDATDTFVCSVDNKSYTVTLTKGTYTPASFANALNTAFTKEGVMAQASISGGRLVLSTKEAKGTASRISYSTANGGTSCEALFGELVRKTPASATISSSLLSTIKIAADENKYTVRVTDEAGKQSDVSVAIPAGTYSPDTLADTLNSLFSGKGIKVTQSGGQLTFTTVAKGEKVSLLVDNVINGSGSAGKAMFGENSVTTPDITASFTDDGKLKLTGSDTGNSYTLSVSSKTSPDFLADTTTTTSVSPTAVAGKLQSSCFNLKSTNRLGSSVKIEDYNADYQFKYNANGNSVSVSIALEEGTYTLAQLKDKLQEKIEEKLGTDALTVSVNNNGGITISANHYGSEYSLEDNAGGFYKYVLQGVVERGSEEKTSSTPGKQSASDIYIIGRKEIRGKNITLTEHLTDEFGMDVTIAGVTYTLNMKLAPGVYSNQELVQELQKQISQRAQEAGLPENCVLVGIGKFNSGVVGSCDENALNFYINPDINLPEGDFRIDNLTGNALYEFFYKTEGELIPAYITGTRDISYGVNIDDDKTEFQFCIDDEQYSYSLDPGSYTSEEFIQMLNDKLEKPDQNGLIAPIYASVSGNAVKLSFEKLGVHNIHDVSGSAMPQIFVNTHGRKDYNSDLNIQVGANAMELVSLERYSMSTISMGINSLTVSKWKNAQKALGRIDQAIDYLSMRRSVYGAKENRMEHVIRGNDNTAENLQSSESKLKDADIADETLMSAKQQIIQQAQIAMLANANQSKQGILRLLQ